jgi:hypothetical protein
MNIAKISRTTLYLEAFFLMLVFAGMSDTFYIFLKEGYLQPPFMYDTLDDFMDGFNTAYWANNEGAYDMWGTVYPPLSFVFAKIFSIKACYVADSVAARACDWVLPWTLVVFLVINLYIVFRCFRLQDKTTSLVRTLAFGFGLPMIFALDRGNLILVAFTFFALAHGRLLRSARLRWLAMALSINFKPYLIVTLLPLVLRRRWRWLEGAGLAMVAVFLVTWGILGEGSFFEVLNNNLTFSNLGGNAPFASSFYANSYIPIVKYIQSVPATTYVGSQVLDIIDTVPAALIRLGQLGVIVAFLAAALRPYAVPTFRLTALAVTMAISSVEVGGYAQVFLLFLVFLERWKGIPLSIALISAYVLCIPDDRMAVSLYNHVTEDYLSGRTIYYPFGMSWGSFIRPGLVLVIEYALTAATLVDVFRAGAGAPKRTPDDPTVLAGVVG